MKATLGILFLLLPQLRAGYFVCPPAEQIRPCECRSHPAAAVRCDGITNLASVRDVLGDYFREEPLPRLQLYNVHTLSLPPYALGSLSPKRLVVRNSHIRSIDEHAFEGQATSLGLLILAEDRLQDVPSASLHRLTGLRSLSLAGNLLMTVKKGAFDPIDTLRFLVLSDNRISEIQRDAFPRNLDTLVLSRNLLSTLNGSLEDLHELQELMASGNRLADLQGELRGLYRLKRLALDNNYISNISRAFEDLSDLRTLGLSSNRIRDIGRSLSGLHRLQFLNLSQNALSDLDLRGLELLEILDVSGNDLSGICATLRPLMSLRELSLSDMNLISLEPDCFQSARNLVRLDLSHNRLSMTDPAFGHTLPSLLYLKLDHNRLHSFSKGAWNLRELDVRSNNLSSFHFHQWKHLTILRIGGNPWKCTKELLQRLRSLEERGTYIQGWPSC